MYKMDLALNNLQMLMCHKTKPNQTNTIYNTKVLLRYKLLNGPNFKLNSLKSSRFILIIIIIIIISFWRVFPH